MFPIFAMNICCFFLRFLFDFQRLHTKIESLSNKHASTFVTSLDISSPRDVIFQIYDRSVHGSLWSSYSVQSRPCFWWNYVILVTPFIRNRTISWRLVIVLVKYTKSWGERVNEHKTHGKRWNSLNGLYLFRSFWTGFYANATRRGSSR